MNRIYRKLKRNTKALSPVVASIILIAVTVAVSVAVAAWMGGISFGFMQTEQVTITNVQFTDAGATLTLTIKNSGSSDVTINSATVNGATATLPTDVVLEKNTETTSFELTLGTGNTWTAGNTYQVKLVSAKGTNFVYSAVA